MQNVVIIGIAGPKRAGKNTASRILKQCLAEYDKELYVGETAFADPMYEMLGRFVGADVIDRLRDSDDKDTEIIEPFGCTLRHMAQTLGTEWGRNLIHSDAWVMSIRRRIQGAIRDGVPENDGIVIFIPDVRFDEEAQFVRENGFLIHIDRPSAEDSHASEAGVALEDGDGVIGNFGDLYEYEQKVFDYGRSTLHIDITAALQASSGNGRLLPQ